MMNFELIRVMGEVNANSEVLALLVKLGKQALASGDANNYLKEKLRKAVGE